MELEVIYAQCPYCRSVIDLDEGNIPPRLIQEWKLKQRDTKFLDETTHSISCYNCKNVITLRWSDIPFPHIDDQRRKVKVKERLDIVTREISDFVKNDWEDLLHSDAIPDYVSDEEDFNGLLKRLDTYPYSEVLWREALILLKIKKQCESLVFSSDLAESVANGVDVKLDKIFSGLLKVEEALHGDEDDEEI